MELILVYLGLALGMFVRVVFPYVRKWLNGEVHSFNHKYLRSTGAAVILFLITTPMVTPDIPDGAAWYQVIAVAATAGYGLPSFIAHMGLGGK